MNTLEAIAQRRSIRRFKPDPIPDELVTQILHAAIQAPSAKNRQPWRFVVVRGERRTEMVHVMREGIVRLEGLGIQTGSARGTARVMEQAPVTVFVFNACGEHAPDTAPEEDKDDVTDVQSIGAAIQNMTLAAQDLGLGSLWICDVLYAYDGLCAWLGQTCQLIAAVALGYADERPPARPRKPLAEVVEWR
ncbi:MAG: nitroreductase family protein [Chloroflexi bacterium]|nr:nitroreductase family protein [Chloroflexota bacterium]MBU1880028.1 nitroreductase family protein [Chloroflexota bacterium]